MQRVDRLLQNLNRCSKFTPWLHMPTCQINDCINPLNRLGLTELDNSTDWHQPHLEQHFNLSSPHVAWENLQQINQIPLALWHKWVKLIKLIEQWARRPNVQWTFAQHPNLPTKMDWSQMTINMLKTTRCNLKWISPASLMSGDPELLILRKTKPQAELLIEHLASVQNLPYLMPWRPEQMGIGRQYDLSSKSRNGLRTATAAVTGPH